MKPSKMTATKLRGLLSFSLVLISIGCFGVFYMASGQLKASATEASRVIADAEASRNNLQALQTLQAELEKQRDTIARVDSVVANSQSYEYQNQIIADINKYAVVAKIDLTNIDFGTKDAAAGASTAPAPGVPVAAPTPSGLKSTTVTISLKSPTNYINLLNFVHLIEQNLPKMQISKMNLTSDGKSDQVGSDALVIEVYIK